VPANDQRRARRIAINVPTTVKVVGQTEIKLHDRLASVYERVTPPAERAGESFPAMVRDLSTNGAFISGEALPLMSRVAFSFPLEGYGQVEALGWALWRRTSDVEIERDDGSTITLPMGFGVLFEAVPLDARIAIHQLVDTTAR
jgi:hypothetical protein